MPLVSTPTQADVVKRIEADFRFETGANPLRRTVEYGLLKALAGQSRGLYGQLATVKKLAFPDTAAPISEAYFWRWGAIFGIDKKPAEPWIGVVRFEGTDTTAIPAGTELVRSDGWRYITTEDQEVGEDVSGQVDLLVEAQDDYEGISGNLTDDAPLAFASAPVGVNVEGAVLSTTTEGVDEETTEDGLARLLLQYRTPRRGGGEGDYEFWALEVSGVTRAWESSTAPQEVSVAVVRDNDVDELDEPDILPDAGERETVRAYVQSKAPLTVVVSITELVAAPLAIEITDLTPDTSEVRAAIVAELKDFFVRETEPGGTILPSQIDEAISIATGETGHTLVSPSGATTVGAAELSTYGGLTVS